MDTFEYTTLAAALKAVPDPRKRRGQRYPWSLLLILIAAALASGEHHGRGIGQWVQEHATELARWLAWSGSRLPSEATLRRALRTVDLDALERHLARFVPATKASRSGRWQGLALDGKALRGARTHGRPIHLLGLVNHQGRVLGQLAVAEHTNEIPAAPVLLAGRDLRGTVTTLDAGLAQRGLATQIRRQGGQYLMVVKRNQPTLLQRSISVFQHPVWQAGKPAARPRVARTVDKGHGRLEIRTLEACDRLGKRLKWPGVRQVLRRTCRRVHLLTGQIEEQVHYAVTSVPPEAVSVAELERLWRGHWVIENQVHYVRDVTLGEDGGQAYQGSTPQALAALRNGVLNVLRSQGWTRIADALRHYGAAVERALSRRDFDIALRYTPVSRRKAWSLLSAPSPRAAAPLSHLPRTQ